MGKHYKEREHAEYTAMSVAFAKAFVEKRREQEKENMLQRERAIDKGSRHETPAAKFKRMRRTQHAD